MSTTAFDVISPVDETIVETVRFAGRAEMDARVERADRAFATWRRVAPGDRARLLRRFADAVDADIETLAASVHALGSVELRWPYPWWVSRTALPSNSWERTALR